MALETKIKVKLTVAVLILCGMSPHHQLTTFYIVVFYHCAFLSLYLHVLAHLTLRLNVSYRYRWVSVVHHQQLLQRKSPIKQLAWF